MHIHVTNERDLSAAQLASIDAHVSNCLFCAHAAADRAVTSAAWERRGWLGRLVRVDLPPPVVARPVEDELEARAA
jgi:hypothetical protein